MTYGNVRILKRRKGIRPRAKTLPATADPTRVEAILTGSNYQVAARMWADQGYVFASRVIVDTGSAASLIQEELLPDGTTLNAADPSRWHLFDVNGGLLPIVGSVDLSICIESYRTSVTFGVVPRMSVPVLLGTDFTDVHMPAICGPQRYVRLLNGESVPILRYGRTVNTQPVEETASTPKPLGAGATLCLAKGVQLPPRSRGYVLVSTPFQGNGFVSTIDRVYHKHQVQVAPGPMTCGKGQSWWVEILNTSNQSRRLPAGMKIASICNHEGSITAVTNEQWEKLGTDLCQDTPPESAEKMPHEHRENVPKALHQSLDDVVQKHHKLWNGDLGLIKATEHRIRLKPGAKPVRLNPYRMGQASR